MMEAALKPVRRLAPGKSRRLSEDRRYDVLVLDELDEGQAESRGQIVEVEFLGVQDAKELRLGGADLRGIIDGLAELDADRRIPERDLQGHVLPREAPSQEERALIRVGIEPRDVEEITGLHPRRETQKNGRKKDKS